MLQCFIISLCVHNQKHPLHVISGPVTPTQLCSSPAHLLLFPHQFCVLKPYRGFAHCWVLLWILLKYSSALPPSQILTLQEVQRSRNFESLKAQTKIWCIVSWWQVSEKKTLTTLVLEWKTFSFWVSVNEQMVLFCNITKSAWKLWKRLKMIL